MLVSSMERGAKITVEVPEGLLEKAQEASGAGMTQAVRAGLKHVAAFRTYERAGVAGTGKTIGRSEAATRRRRHPWVNCRQSKLATACWQRARLRAKALAKDRKARMGETLITQGCLDAGILLLTRDRDVRVRPFAEVAGLRLAP
jgi:hypothetical protein